MIDTYLLIDYGYMRHTMVERIETRDMDGETDGKEKRMERGRGRQPPNESDLLAKMEMSGRREREKVELDVQDANDYRRRRQTRLHLRPRISKTTAAGRLWEERRKRLREVGDGSERDLGTDGGGGTESASGSVRRASSTCGSGSDGALGRAWERLEGGIRGGRGALVEEGRVVGG